jgi:hypothetical protein
LPDSKYNSSFRSISLQLGYDSSVANGSLDVDIEVTSAKIAVTIVNIILGISIMVLFSYIPFLPTQRVGVVGEFLRLKLDIQSKTEEQQRLKDTASHALENSTREKRSYNG